MNNSNNWIYHNSDDNKARFVLGEKWEKILICFGINPSTAKPWELDNTLKTVKRFSQNLWYDWRIMLNVYPERATNPNDLDFTINEIYHSENLNHIEEILKNKNCDIWAARGTLVEKRKYLVRCLKDIYNISKKYSINWYSIGNKSKKWHPHHPLYLSKTLILDQFNMDDYINNFTWNTHPKH